MGYDIKWGVCERVWVSRWWPGPGRRSGGVHRWAASPSGNRRARTEQAPPRAAGGYFTVLLRDVTVARQPGSAARRRRRSPLAVSVSAAALARVTQSRGCQCPTTGRLRPGVPAGRRPRELPRLRRRRQRPGLSLGTHWHRH